MIERTVSLNRSDIDSVKYLKLPIVTSKLYLQSSAPLSLSHNPVSSMESKYEGNSDVRNNSLGVIEATL